MKIVIFLLSTIFLFAKGPTSDSIKAVVSKNYDIDKQYIDVRNLKGVGESQGYLIEIDNASNNKSYSIVNIDGIETSISEMKSSPLGVYSYTYIYNSETLNAIGDFFKNHKDSENISDKKEFTLFKVGTDNIKNFKINRITSANILINDHKYFSNNSQFIAPVFSYDNKLTGFYIYKNKISEMDIMMQETNKFIDKEYTTLDKIQNNNSKTSPVLIKSYLYKEPSESSKSKMYLIAGDKVKLLATNLFEIFTKNTGVKSINQGDKKVFTFDFDGNEVKDTIEIQNCSVRITTNKSKVQTVSLENQCGECQDLKVTQDPSYFFIGFFGSDYGDLYAYKYDTSLKNWFLEGVISKSKDGQKNIYDETIYTEQKSIDNTATKITTSEEKIKTLKQKTLLYKEASESSQSKMYLIAGDKVKLLDTKTDKSGQEWYYISYQGKKEIKAWIKAEAVKLKK